MKFFSNEKETEPQDDPDRTQHVSSGPVTVPPQRAGSPWSDAPRDPETARDTDAEPARGTEEQVVTSTTYGPDGSVVEDTTYRATHADHVTDRPRDDSPVDLPLTDDEEKSPTAAAIKDDGTFDGPTAVDPATGDKLDGRGPEGRDGRAPEDAVKDDGTFDGPTAVDPATGEALDRSGERDSQRASDASGASAAAGSVPATPAAPVAEAAAVPVAVVPAGGASSGDSAGAAAAGAGAVAAPAFAAGRSSSGSGSAGSGVAGSGSAGSGASGSGASGSGSAGSGSAGSGSSGERLLPDGDSFAERFRDIQLRFVDEPKEATAEAATLVGEAVDKLTSALKAQRDGLAGNSDDTEKLRVELRAYRDILNRLLAL